MSVNKNLKRKKEKKKIKLSRPAIVLIVGLAIILIPIIIFLSILITAFFQTGKPINGHRFDGDLDPAITKAQISEVQKNVSEISGVQSAEVILKTATLRVYVDVEDNFDQAKTNEVLKQAEQKVNQTIPEDTYFKATDTKKMYDLEIHVYNKEKREDDSFVYYILNRNSRMDKPKIQLVSKPLNEDLAKELRAEAEKEKEGNKQEDKKQENKETEEKTEQQ